jgi:8-amino-7-oxononanoate synthase
MTERTADGGDLLDKLRAVAVRRASFGPDVSCPGDTVIDEVLGPCEVMIRGVRTLMLGSNNYFGLTFHPAVLAAAREAVDRYGSGTTGSRAANGSTVIHAALERDFARFFDKQRAMIFTTGYQANLSVIAGLCGPDDVVLMDADSHASIYDAARLSGAQTIVFRHNSPQSLAQRLGRLPAGRRNRLVVVEGLYSMRGDVAPLREIVAVCRAAGAYLLVDEAHSFGVYGAGGRGWAEEQGVLADCDFTVGTFSKALVGVGGFCVSNHPELDSLRFLARSYVFTASGSPGTIAGVQAALRVVARDASLRERLWANSRRLREGLAAHGCPVGSVQSPIVAIPIGEEATAIHVWQGLLDAGVYVNIVVPPVCGQDRCQLRASCSAAHTPQQIDRAVNVISGIMTKAGAAPAR